MYQGVEDVEGETCCEPLEPGDEGVLAAATYHRGGILICGYQYEHEDVES